MSREAIRSIELYCVLIAIITHAGLATGMSRSLLKFAERTLLFKSYAASAI
jgi:hypothetical protein